MTILKIFIVSVLLILSYILRDWYYRNRNHHFF